MCKAKSVPTYHMNMSYVLDPYCDHGVSLLEEHTGTYKFAKANFGRSFTGNTESEFIDNHPTIGSHSKIAKLISKKFNVNPINEQCRLEFLKLHNDITAGKYTDLQDVNDKWRQMRLQMEKEGIKKAHPDIFQL